MYSPPYILMLDLAGKGPMSGGCASRNGLRLLSFLQRLSYTRLGSNGSLRRGCARNWTDYLRELTPRFLSGKLGDSGAGHKGLPKQYVFCDRLKTIRVLTAPYRNHCFSLNQIASACSTAFLWLWVASSLM